jgi:hypothetical protein
MDPFGAISELKAKNKTFVGGRHPVCPLLKDGHTGACAAHNLHLQFSAAPLVGWGTRVDRKTRSVAQKPSYAASSSLLSSRLLQGTGIISYLFKASMTSPPSTLSVSFKTA